MQRLSQATRSPPVCQTGPAKRNIKARAATTERASVRQPRPENAEGSFFVDHTCIDCDTCRWMAPETFQRVGGQTAVTEQPEEDVMRHRALQALLACPTFSIHCTDKAPGELRSAVESFPTPVEGSSHAFHTGFASEHSYGATSYLLVREGGNVLVDSPRFDPKLLKQIQNMGGAKYMFLTHRDDVADHARWASALGCDRIIHRDEANARQGTNECEIKLKGQGPWRLPDGGEDVSIIHTPGHTSGHIVLYFHPEQVLFSGDHLMFRASGEMSIARYYNWHSVEKQLESVAAVGEMDVRILLPGHGRRGTFLDSADRDAKIADVIARES